MDIDPVFFPTQQDFREWLLQHHLSKQELWVGYYKKDSGLESITWPESVDEALCFGWIDGLRKSIDSISYKIRFTPRKPNSHWSAVNIERIGALIDAGLVQEAGIQPYARKKAENSLQASYEQKNPELPQPYEKQIKAHPEAWDFFQSLAPSYKKASIWWIIQAKKAETRQRRLSILIESSANGQKIPPLLNGKK
ncbi:MAG: YdeI/OmpD-associated family protein [Cyclobacteriaceae bacterium]|nr:YdeI/OmpD-associated family protein [Cyclobacteriaceae bacterium HetDA_MAG_MS6]